MRMMLVARMLIKVVPSLFARMPPTRGVQVLFNPYAESNKPNSVWDVPSSRCNRLFKGPKK